LESDGKVANGNESAERMLIAQLTACTGYLLRRKDEETIEIANQIGVEVGGTAFKRTEMRSP
jgi:hypothetical protein